MKLESRGVQPETDLIGQTARELVRHLREGALTPIDLLDALEHHLMSSDDRVNALPVRFLEHARDRAKLFLRQRPEPTDRGWLAGLPIAVKDFNDVAGQPTSFGSPIFAGKTASSTDATVRILERHGAIPYAKSNVPEIAGGHTYNTVWGATRNPWNLERSAGGSSGGSAAALASGSAWLATGNDLGGSLRTPSGYNGTVSVRPTPGRVPRRRPAIPYDPMWVEGPMARNVADVALMLDAMVGTDPYDPLTCAPPPVPFLTSLNQMESNLRVAYSPDLGQVPVEESIRQVTERSLQHFTDFGYDVTEACPDFSGAYDAFQALRAHLLAAMHGDLLASERGRLKDDIVWNIELGLNQPQTELQRAELTRGELIHQMVDFFDDYDILVCPSAPLDPFPVQWTYPYEVAGTKSHTYIDWIAITFIITLTGCPVVTVPCGFSPQGLPVGLQIIGPRQSEARLLAVAAAFEKVVGIAPQLPITPHTEEGS